MKQKWKMENCALIIPSREMLHHVIIGFLYLTIVNKAIYLTFLRAGFKKKKKRYGETDKK